MKLLLASEGFHTEEIAAACEELVGKSRKQIKIAVINEGYAVQKDTLRWVLVNLNDVQKHFDGKLELINLLAFDSETIKKRLEEFDVIFVVGGDADYLMSVFNKTGFTKLLPELLKSKVYVGSSAGSMIMGKRLPDEITNKIYTNDPNYKVSSFLEYVPFSFVAHLNNKTTDRKHILLESTKDFKNIFLYGLEDDSAIIVRDSKITTIGSEPLVINSLGLSGRG